MSAPQVPKEALNAIANMLKLSINDGSLDELLPQIQRASDSMAQLDSLDLKNVEPAVIFTPQTE